MAISANSIIHYTEEYETLKKILSDRGFKMKYCSEKVTTRGGNSYSLGIVMVSFCDIPLTEYKKYFKNTSTNYLGYYGDYGIGLSKNWATDNGLNPVIYVGHNSFVGTALRKTIDLHMKSPTSIDVNNLQKNEFAFFACYSKNYQGELKRNGITVKKIYRFYDEREWRHVPKTEDIGNNEIIVEGEKYEANKDHYNDSITSHRLKFSFSDISYIIVKDSSQINDLIEHLKTFFSGYDDPDFQLVISKIITSEQIINDF